MREKIPADIRPVSKVLMELDEWHVGVPLTPWAMFWWGNFTEWCTANINGCFDHYTTQGRLIIFRSRVTRCRWMLHAATCEFRDANNRRASWRGFLMRNGDLAAGLMMGLRENR